MSPVSTSYTPSPAAVPSSATPHTGRWSAASPARPARPLLSLTAWPRRTRPLGLDWIGLRRG